jgi:hypothetical protein
MNQPHEQQSPQLFFASLSPLPSFEALPASFEALSIAFGDYLKGLSLLLPSSPLLTFHFTIFFSFFFHGSAPA